MGRLERKLDPEAIARALRKAGPEVKPITRQKPPRHFSTYRGYRRNKKIHGMHEDA